MKALLDDAEVRVRVSSNVLDDIFDTGRMKSQFETGTSSGVLSPASRAEWETQLFGYSPDLPAEQRPIYGYVASKDAPAGESDAEGVAMYGDAILRLKDDVRERSSVTFTDSVEAEVAPSPMTGQPKMESTITFDAYPSGSVYGDAWDPLTWERSWDVPGYAEAQVHGGVQASDIEEVILTLDNPTAEKYLEANGIRYRYASRRDNMWRDGRYLDE